MCISSVFVRKGKKCIQFNVYLTFLRNLSFLKGIAQEVETGNYFRAASVWLRSKPIGMAGCRVEIVLVFAILNFLCKYN